jgi:predicted ArsR family transcriptional regulator
MSIMEPMSGTALNTRFLTTTRGRIVSLLRQQGRTVRELADTLELTENAVRAHLTTLERDGLIRRGDLRRGTRKPYFTYELTPEAEHLFPKAYSLVLNQLLSVLQSRVKQATLDEVLREVGRQLAAMRQPYKSDLKRRLDDAVVAFGELGGLAEIEKKNGHVTIRGRRCPLSTISVSHPAICLMAESLLTELLGVRVTQACKTTEPVACVFAVHAAAVHRHPSR